MTKPLTTTVLIAASLLTACSGAATSPAPTAITSVRPTPPGARAIDADANEFYTQKSLPLGERLPSKAQLTQWLQRSGSPDVPSNAKLTTGILTPPSGGGPLRVLAWSWHQCGPWMGGPGMTPPPPRCTAWVFLNAATGKFVDSTFSN